MKKHLPGVAGLAVLLLAVYEAAAALLAPFRAPADRDWNAVSQRVREGFRPGDLIVAAPAWADQTLRLHLGDLMSLEMAARLDGAPYGRVWEVSQRGARAPEATGTLALDERLGGLRLRRWERPAAKVTFDFVADWRDARVFRSSAGARVPCALLPDRHQCPDIAFNWVKPEVLEFDFTLHKALYAQPVAGAELIIAYDDVPLGTALVVGAGLHNVWLRKGGQGEVTLKVEVGGRPIGQVVVHNRSSWDPVTLDTQAFAGQRQQVRFVITSATAVSRHFGFAAEART